MCIDFTKFPIILFFSLKYKIIKIHIVGNNTERIGVHELQICSSKVTYKYREMGNSSGVDAYLLIIS